MIAVSVAAGLAAGALASPAGAQVRSGQVADPQDAGPPVSGTARAPDIEQLRIAYDPAGSLTVTVRLYELFRRSTGEHPFLWLQLLQGPACDAVGYAVFHGVLDGTEPDGNEIALPGVGAHVPVQRQFNDAERETTFTASAPELAGRNFSCVTFPHLYRVDRDNLHCYPSDADCRWMTNEVVGDGTADFFFDGFAPACEDGKDNDGDGRVDYPADSGCRTANDADESGEPQCNDGKDNDGNGKVDWPQDPGCGDQGDISEDTPDCRDGVDNDGDGKTDKQDPGCLGKGGGASEIDPAPVASSVALTAASRRCGIGTKVEVRPRLRPLAVFPFAHVSVRVRRLGSGRRYDRRRELPLATTDGYRFAGLAGGKYQVTARYLGDPWRTRSSIAKRRVRVARVCGAPR